MKKLITQVSVYIYSTIFEIVRFIGIPILSKMKRSREWKVAERQKMPYSIRDHRGHNVVWLHAASLGEAKLLYKFIEILERVHPEDLYAVTGLTKNGVEYLEQHRTNSVCAIGYMPLDTLSLVNQLITKFQVSRVWLLETEIWPCMIYACISKGIPIGIMNARMETNSFTMYKFFRWAMGYLFESIDIVLAQNEEYADRYVQVGVNRERIRIVGNIKSYIIVKRPNIDDWRLLRKNLNIEENACVITAGCIHPGEGIVLRRSQEMLESMGLKTKLIIVPRHLQEVSVLMDEIGEKIIRLHDLTTHRFWDCCIIEKVGILEDMYKLADAAIVGGTFVNVGGHNVWEPARFGIPVFFGPDYHTQTESCEKLMNSGVGFKTGNSEDLAAAIYKVLRTDARKFIQSEMQFMEMVNKRRSVLEPLIP